MLKTPMNNHCIILVLALTILYGCTQEITTNTITNAQTDTITTSHEIEDRYIKYNEHDHTIKRIANKYSIDWTLVKAIIIKESHFDPNYISSTGAIGLMQLMPRKGSYFSDSYKGFTNARRQTRNKVGQRIYNGKKDIEWATQYRSELDSIFTKYKNDTSNLYSIDQRFNVSWNINSGVEQFANDFYYFKKRGHGTYGSRIYALAAYNAGRGAVVRSKENGKLDKIPINRQTELYVGLLERIYSELKLHEGLINETNDWVLKL